jgi:matrixin
LVATRILLASFATALVLVLPHGGALVPVTPSVMPWDNMGCSGAEALYEDFVDPIDPSLRVSVHVICQAPGQAAVDAGGCTATAYASLSYKWTSKYSAQVDSASSGLAQNTVVSGFQSSGNTWDSSTSGAIMGTVSAGGSGADAGRHDGKNQLGWKQLASGVIAQTTTWSTQQGVAVESDGAYSTRFTWSSSGEANEMDLQNIATHEIGHTFGLGHPASTTANSCLTMYAYADYGETQKRSLGTGDSNGIKAKYG